MPKDRDSIPRRTRRPRAAALVVLPCLIGCGGSDPATQVQRAGSWAATTRELAIERSVNRIGRAYTIDLLEAGRRDVNTIVTSLDTSSLPDSVRSRAPAVVRRLDALMLQTAGAARRGDPVALGAAAASAAALGDTLRAFHEAMSAK